MVDLFGRCVAEEPPAILPDIHPGIFDWFFDSEEYSSWYQSESIWQLHCVGGPGSGKTTLSTLAMRRLQEHCRTHKNRAVASLFILEDVVSNEANFVEDALVSIYHQLGKSNDDLSFSAYQQYEEVCQKGSRVALRIEAIRKALETRLSSIDRAFVIFDDLDRCNQALDVLLREQLAILQRQRLKVMTTSRLPLWQVGILDVVPDDVFCDGPRCPRDPSERLSLFWVCADCTEDPFVLCYSCIDDKPVCAKCSNTCRFFEPYDDRSLEIDNIPDSSMVTFVAWALEREHGDLGFGSSSEAKRRPLSILGMALRHNRVEGAEELRTSIVDEAAGNVGMAKLRVELTYGSQALEEVKVNRDRLPSNIIAIFDAGIRRLEKQPKAQRELGLMIIAGSCRELQGVPLKTLEDWIGTSFRSPEDVFHVTGGFVKVDIKVDQIAERRVQAYHHTFGAYVREDYNESLFWAGAQLRITKIPRAASVEAFRVPELTSTNKAILNHFPDLRTVAPDKSYLERLGKVKRGRTRCWGYIWKSISLE